MERLALFFSGEREIDVSGCYASFGDLMRSENSDCTASADIVLYSCKEFDASVTPVMAKIREMGMGFDLMVYAESREPDSVIGAIRAGSTSYILKESPLRELVEAIHLLYGGAAPLSPAVSRLVVREVSVNGHCCSSVRLSRKEKEILKSLGRGLTYKLIADQHSISYHTVHAHIKNIYDKLDTNNREDALLRAKKHNLI